MPLTAQNAEFLQSLADAGAQPFHTMEPVQCRQAFDALLLSMPATTATVADISDSTIPGPGGDLAVRVYTPDGPGPFPALLYLHGGGWVIGSLDANNNLCTELSARAEAVVIAVDYRKAPEASFPAGSDDCMEALRWIAANAQQLNIDPARIAVGGDSAGANLSAVTAQRTRDEGGPRLCGQLLFYPMVRLAGGPTASMLANAEGPLLSRTDIEYFVNHYVGKGVEARHPYCSPLLADSFADLAPALVQTAEFDPLLDDGEDYARALKDAGNDVVLTRYDGAFHGMLCFPTALDQSKEMLTEAIDWLRKRFADN